MKKLVFVAIIAALAIPAFASPTVQMSNPAGQGYRATVITGGTAPTLGVTFTAGQTIDTFCVEGADAGIVYMNYTTVYDVTVDEYILDGGATFANGGIPTKPTNATKMLYSAFLNGVDLSSINIQNEIWDFEDGDNSPSATLADLNTNTGLSLTASDIEGWRGVKVLNLWTYDADLNKVDAQSQLIRVPAPGAFLLGGIGVACIGWIKRRRML